MGTVPVSQQKGTVTHPAIGIRSNAVVVERPDGTKSTAGGPAKPDGSASRVTGSESRHGFDDHAEPENPGDGREPGGPPASTRVFSLSDDGTHMIETAMRHLPDGTPYSRVAIWTRQ
jgi:hypothetical protein